MTYGFWLHRGNLFRAKQCVHMHLNHINNELLTANNNAVRVNENKIIETHNSLKMSTDFINMLIGVLLAHLSKQCTKSVIVTSQCPASVVSFAVCTMSHPKYNLQGKPSKATRLIFQPNFTVIFLWKCLQIDLKQMSCDARFQTMWQKTTSSRKAWLTLTSFFSVLT